MTYQEFWPIYLKAHSKPLTKILHATGTTLGIGFLIFCLVDKRPLWIPLSPVIGYAFAWISHFYVERNKPATFGHPFWSFISDFRMVYELLTGKLKLNS